jgi:hypothetical protein
MKNKKPSPEQHHIFERGDIVTTLDKKDVRVILKAEDRTYHFMNLKAEGFKVKDIFNKTINIEKGSEGSQPADIVEKHFCLFQI